MGEFDEHSDDEGAIDKRLIGEGDGREPEHQGGIAGCGSHRKEDVLWAIEAKVPSEYLAQHPCKKEKQEDR